MEPIKKNYCKIVYDVLILVCQIVMAMGVFIGIPNKLNENQKWVRIVEANRLSDRAMEAYISGDMRNSRAILLQASEVYPPDYPASKSTKEVAESILKFVATPQTKQKEIEAREELTKRLRNSQLPRSAIYLLETRDTSKAMQRW